MGKHAQRLDKDLNSAQKSFLATNPSSASNLVIEELWFGELKMSATIPACLKRSVKFPTSVMVWGGVGLCINKRYGQYCLPQINSYIYTILCMEVLESHLVSSIEDLYGMCDEDMIFQQDLAPAHFSRSCT